MANANKIYPENEDKTAFLERQKKLENNRKKKKMKAIDTRRYIIIGKIVVRIFPELLKYQPQRTEGKNAIEFAEFIKIVSLLEADKDYITQLKYKVKHKK